MDPHDLYLILSNPVKAVEAGFGFYVYLTLYVPMVVAILYQFYVTHPNWVYNIRTHRAMPGARRQLTHDLRLRVGLQLVGLAFIAVVNATLLLYTVVLAIGFVCVVLLVFMAVHLESLKQLTKG